MTEVQNYPRSTTYANCYISHSKWSQKLIATPTIGTMEKKHGVLFTKLTNLPILFALLMMMMFHGFSHGSRVDQAGRLRAVRRAKRHARSFSNDDQEWTMSNLDGGEELSFDGGKMEDDLIAGKNEHLLSSPVYPQGQFWF